MSKICPNCGKPYTGFPALSRRDNKTLICSDCGVMEAMKDFFKAEPEKESFVTSDMTYWNGIPVTVHLYWDEDFYYYWIEPSIDRETAQHYEGMISAWEDTDTECQCMDIRKRYDLEEINTELENLCGDDMPAGFYEDELGVHSFC